MQIQEIEFSLKDGRRAVLRCATPEDVEGTLHYLRVSAGETDFILRYPEECDKYTPEKELAFFERFNDSPTDVMLLCLVDGVVAGNCQITFNSAIKTRHRASVAIGLMSEYWNLGIGTKMLEVMIRLAEERADVTQMELEFVEGNDRARHLYEKMGFRITGVRPNAIRLKDGTMLNGYEMVREIRRS